MPPTKLTDDQLIVLLKKDDRAAFTEIYNRYAESLAGFAASKLYNLEDAKDIIHDLFVKLWRDRDAIVITGGLKTYLFSATRYGVVDKIRRNITRESYAAAAQALEEQYDYNIEQYIAAKELQGLVDKSLNDLPVKTKQIYQLSRNEHWSIAEFAEMHGLAEQTVKNQLTIALKHLRQSVTLVSISAILFHHWLK
jgi:RNA polymerase sigma-70 factor (ECF subfamily)